MGIVIRLGFSGPFHFDRAAPGLFAALAMAQPRFRVDDFDRDDPRDADFLRDDDFFFLPAEGTLPPSRRASDSPMAIACFRLVTFLPDRPLFSVPSLRSCIARSTFCDAFFPYR